MTSPLMGHSTREFCGCATHPEGEECGMVVCWKCEQIVSKVDDEGAITTAWMQTEIERLREILSEVAAAGVSFEDPHVGYVEVQIDRATWAAVQVQEHGGPDA